MSRKWAIAALMIMVAALLPGLWRAAMSTGRAPVPERIGEWRLLDSVSGEGALVQLERLHGRPVGVDKAYMARYGSPRGEVMIWVADARSAGRAAELLDRMKRGLVTGAPFKLRGKVDIGRPAYELRGVGQKHYLYRRAAQVVWLNVDRKVPTSALADLARRVGGK